MTSRVRKSSYEINQIQLQSMVAEKWSDGALEVKDTRYAEYGQAQYWKLI
jgi:hypothetical protein